MRAGEVLRRSAVALQSDQTVHDAATVMESAGVGAVAVCDGDRLTGIVTDRDLVRRALAHGLPPDARVDGVMSAPVTAIAEDADIHDAFALLRGSPFRRLAVVRGERFVGMITVDDLLVELATDLASLVQPVASEVRAPQHDSTPPMAR